MPTDSFAVCEHLASAGRNNLWQAARRLTDPARYRFFLATYASMRWIDDQVDDGFLTLPAAERTRRRGAHLALIDQWWEDVRAAAEGRYRPGGDPAAAAVFDALQDVLGRVDLGIWPWRLLARSLRRDVEERPVLTWDEFFEYCEGATEAPAAVFLYLLGWREGDDGRATFGSEELLRSAARHMGRFCYLVHILRDLRLDAARADQLLSIPRELLAEHGFTVEGFKAAVLSEDPAAARPVLRAFHRVARTSRDAAMADAAGLTARFTPESREILAGLLGVYDRLLGDSHL